MSEYLAESFVPRARATGGPPGLDDLARVAEQLAREGTRIRLKRSIVVPDEETCFYLFEATSEDAVREAATRSGLRFERVVEAISGRPEERTRSTERRKEEGI
jgi:hypothetical protein